MLVDERLATRARIEILVAWKDLVKQQTKAMFKRQAQVTQFHFFGNIQPVFDIFMNV